MDQTDHTNKVYNPFSLMAFAVKEASKWYKFSSHPSCYVKLIDFYCPLPVGIDSSNDYAFTCNRVLSASGRRVVQLIVNRIMGRRTSILDSMYKILADMIVNFERIEEIGEVDMEKLRQRYVKYAKRLAIMHRNGLHIKTQDGIQLLLSYIHDERARQKQMSRFFYEPCLYNKGLRTMGTGYYGDGRGDGANITEEGLVTWVRDDIYRPSTVFDKVRSKRSEFDGGSTVTDERRPAVWVNRQQMDAMPGGRKVNHAQKKVKLMVDKFTEEVGDDDDDSFVLYGMISG